MELQDIELVPEFQSAPKLLAGRSHEPRKTTIPRVEHVNSPRQSLAVRESGKLFLKLAHPLATRKFQLERREVGPLDRAGEVAGEDRRSLAERLQRVALRGHQRGPRPVEHEPERLAVERLDLGADPGHLPLAGHFPEVGDIDPLRPEDPAGGVPRVVEDVEPLEHVAMPDHEGGAARLLVVVDPASDFQTAFRRLEEQSRELEAAQVEPVSGVAGKKPHRATSPGS